MTPDILYHGSSQSTSEALQPVLRHGTPDHTHDKAAVFGTQRIDIAALFMFPLDTLASIGFEHDIAYICIWGTPEEFNPKDRGGVIYELSKHSFTQVGKFYEWQSLEPVTPTHTQKFSSVIAGMISCGVQVYFITDDSLFDRIVADKDHRTPLLKNLISENQRQQKNIRLFP